MDGVDLYQAHLAVIHGISEQLVIQRKGRKVFLENYTFINEVISWRSFDRISIENPLKWNPTFIGTLKFTDLEPWFKFLIFIRQITNQKCEKGFLYRLDFGYIHSEDINPSGIFECCSKVRSMKFAFY